VQRRVPFKPVYRVAFEVGLVEEGVDDFVWEEGELVGLSLHTTRVLGCASGGA
jgi:hypothetical protein